MPLSQEDRISISKKIVQIPTQNAQSDKIQVQLEDAKVLAEKEDNSNKNLMDDITPLVNAYQLEFQRYDGNGRTQLIEQDMVDAVNRKLNNYFFPNDTQRPLPSVPDGVWKNFPSFSGLKGIGKDYIDAGGGNWIEGYTIVQKEQDLIDAINVEIAIIEGLVDATRSTGDECVIVNIPPPTDTIQPSSTMQAAATAMIAAVQAWEDFINITFGVIPTNIQDPDPTRSYPWRYPHH